MKRSKTDYVVQSVAKALDILEALAASGDEELGLNELAEKLNIQKKTAFRILHTIEQRAYVEKDVETGTYRIGLKAFEMGQTYLQQLGLLQAAKPVLKELVSRCDESAFIAVLRGYDVVYLDVIQTSKPLRLASRIGSISPAHATSVGKVQLAYLPRPKLEQLTKGFTLEALTTKTITNPAKFMTELEAIARQGYAVDDEEFEPGVRCVAVPVWDYTNQVVASINISGPLSRITPERIDRELLPLLLEAGAEISRRLGHEFTKTSPTSSP